MKSKHNAEQEIECWEQEVKEHLYCLESGFALIADSLSHQNRAQRRAGSYHDVHHSAPNLRENQP